MPMMSSSSNTTPAATAWRSSSKGSSSVSSVDSNKTPLFMRTVDSPASDDEEPSSPELPTALVSPMDQSHAGIPVDTPHFATLSPKRLLTARRVRAYEDNGEEYLHSTKALGDGSKGEHTSKLWRVVAAMAVALAVAYLTLQGNSPTSPSSSGDAAPVSTTTIVTTVSTVSSSISIVTQQGQNIAFHPVIDAAVSAASAALETSLASTIERCIETAQTMQPHLDSLGSAIGQKATEIGTVLASEIVEQAPSAVLEHAESVSALTARVNSAAIAGAEKFMALRPVLLARAEDFSAQASTTFAFELSTLSSASFAVKHAIHKLRLVVTFIIAGLSNLVNDQYQFFSSNLGYASTLAAYDQAGAETKDKVVSAFFAASGHFVTACTVFGTTVRALFEEEAQAVGAGFEVLKDRLLQVGGTL